MARALLALRRTAAAAVVGVAVLCLLGLVVSDASADPVNPCALLAGKMKQVCENTQHMVTNGGANPPGVTDWVTDPLGAIASSTGQGAAWLLDQISGVVNSVQIDFTNLGWLIVYAVVFGASTVLTVLLWLGGVMRRVIRGAPPTQAFGEAFGFLWFAVLASAFTPIALAMMVTLTDSISTAITNGTQGVLAQKHLAPSTVNAGPGSFLGPLAANLRAGDSAGGSILFIVVAFLTLLTAVVLWLELLFRAAMLYVGGVIAPLVYSGLVQKELWGHVRRWISIVVAIDFIKPLLVIVLVLGEANPSTAPSGGIASILAGTAVLWVAAFGQALLYRMIPGIGDDLAYGRQLRSGVTPAHLRPSVTTTAGAMAAGVATHADRAGNSLHDVATMTVRMQPGANGGGDAQTRIRPEPAAPPPPRRPPAGGGA